MDFPVPLTAETDPINILLRPFDPLPTEVRRGEEDVFWKMVNGDMEVSLKAHEEMARREAAEKARLQAIEAQKALMMGKCVSMSVSVSCSVCKRVCPLENGEWRHGSVSKST